ncbi:hypothetical protein AB0D04_17695 [Streptomyces sp. NPDC048483]|uniref:hypothetical protein n=1 Tax=Streptomyces sp. NPDC048483 TaxID=3154927 RepID=UPI00341333D7
MHTSGIAVPAEITRGESRIGVFLSTASTSLAAAGLAVAVFICGVLVTEDGSGVRVERPATTATAATAPPR